MIVDNSGSMSKPSADYENTLTTLWRLVRLRWFLLAGSLAAIIAVPALLGIPLPTVPLFLVLALLACFNGLASWRLRHAQAMTPQAMGLQIIVDLVALGVLLFLAGGASNPLVSLLLLPVAAAALVLPWSWAAGIAAFAIALYSFLAVWFVPLHVDDAARATSLHLAGMWLTFVVSVILISWLILRMTASIRARDAALATAREQALRDERVVALGSLAAGAAHELGTPLATMAVVVGELEREATLTPPIREDLALLRQQIAACKEIVTGLADRAGAARLEGARAVAADRWLDGVLARWRSTRPRAACLLKMAVQPPAPELVVDATLEQAVVNLLNNAANACEEGIEARLDWNAERLAIEILDRGKGFPPQVLAQAGRAPLSSGTGGAGIGLLLAHAAVGRLGGTMTLANQPEGGGRVRVEFRLAGSLANGKAS